MDRREEEEKEKEQQQQQYYGMSAPSELPTDARGHPHAGLDLDELTLDTSMQGCPMIDGSMDSYISLWDESFVSPAEQSNFLSDMAGFDTGSGALEHRVGGGLPSAGCANRPVGRP
jgi:hypothetical protein